MLRPRSTSTTSGRSRAFPCRHSIHTIVDWQVTGSGGVGLVARWATRSRPRGPRARSAISSPSIPDRVAAALAARRTRSDVGRFPHPGLRDARTAVTSSSCSCRRRSAIRCRADLTLEAAGCYILNLGTVVRALFTTLKIQAGTTMFVEGAATGTGLEALKTSVAAGVKVTGLVSSEVRADAIKAVGATGAINRNVTRMAQCFTPVPGSADAIAAWEDAGATLLDAFRAQNDGHLADYVSRTPASSPSLAASSCWPRAARSTFYGASSGLPLHVRRQARRGAGCDDVRACPTERGRSGAGVLRSRPRGRRARRSGRHRSDRNRRRASCTYRRGLLPRRTA